jgi:hypothetical protein
MLQAQNPAFVLRRRTRGSDGPPLLEALTAIYRTSLRWLKWDRGLFTALRADRFGFDPLNASRTWFGTLRSIGFARLAPLRLVFETLICEKHLFAGGEDELSPTFGALQDLVMVFHTLLRGP